MVFRIALVCFELAGLETSSEHFAFPLHSREHSQCPPCILAVVGGEPKGLWLMFSLPISRLVKAYWGAASHEAATF